MANRRIIGLLVAGALLAGAAALFRTSSRSRGTTAGLSPEAAETAARAYLALEATEQAVDRTLWEPEIDAERYEDEILRLWDTLNAARDRWEALAAYPVAEVRIPEIGPPVPLPQGIFRRTPTSDRSSHLDHQAWAQWLQQLGSNGWTLEGTHWAMVGHRGGSNQVPAESSLRITARLLNSVLNQRISLGARLVVEWSPEESPTPRMKSVTAVSVDLLERTGNPPFSLWLEAELPTGPGVFNDPVLVRDMTGDGFPDILLVGAGEVWVNTSANSQRDVPFRRERAGALPSERIQAAVSADVNGDGIDDLVLAGRDGVRWIPGTGALPWGAPESGWISPIPLKHAQALTAGDVDGDGDVDLWLVQYKLPYQQGQFPTPWFDARDGFPSTLLLNDGRGHFHDATDASGLSAVRNRRGYSASLVDLDLDGDLDLVLVSDFAGLDVLLNEGRGRFRDVTATLGLKRHAFGMSHAVSDVNGDGRPDLLMLGMGSTVAERLAAFGLERRTAGEVPGTVRAMTHGNWMYTGNRDPAMPLQPASDSLSVGMSETGWTWGAAWEDFDNDGLLDLAVANGHETRASTADYERQFWLHDRFVANSTNNPAADFYFRTAAGRRQAAAASYGGWQDNQFRLGGRSGDSPDVAWLLGLAEPADSRNLVAADLDLDGRMDLVVTTQETWPTPRQRLLIYRNRLDAGPWIGFRFAEQVSPGTRIELQLGDRTPARWLINGDGFRSQGPAAVHFGLGAEQLSHVKVHRPGQPVLELQSPVPGQWNVVPNVSSGRK